MAWYLFSNAYVFMASYLVKHGDNFIFTLWLELYFIKTPVPKHFYGQKVSKAAKLNQFYFLLMQIIWNLNSVFLITNESII
jgi:hypothetical protein